MSYEEIDDLYAFAKTLDDYEPGDKNLDTLLYAEAGICRLREKNYDSEIEAKVGTASFKFGNTGLGLGASAKAELGSFSGSTSHSMNVGDQTIDFKTELKAKGPSVGAEAELALTGIGAKLKAELASASSSIGVVGGKIGLAADTGVKVGLDGVEVTVMGTGVSLWPHTGVTFFGSGVSIDTQTIVQTISSWF